MRACRRRYRKRGHIRESRAGNGSNRIEPVGDHTIGRLFHVGRSDRTAIGQKKWPRRQQAVAAVLSSPWMERNISGLYTLSAICQKPYGHSRKNVCKEAPSSTQMCSALLGDGPSARVSEAATLANSLVLDAIQTRLRKTRGSGHSARRSR